jgi:hypothetical protein
MGWYTQIALSEGNPSVLASPFDTDGNQCGVKPERFLDYKFVYFLDPSGIDVRKLQATACLKSCPKWFDTANNSDKPTSLECQPNSQIGTNCNSTATPDEKKDDPSKSYTVSIYNTTVCTPTRSHPSFRPRVLPAGQQRAGHNREVPAAGAAR